MRDEVVRSLLEIVELGITSGHEAEETWGSQSGAAGMPQTARHAPLGDRAAREKIKQSGQPIVWQRRGANRSLIYLSSCRVWQSARDERRCVLIIRNHSLCFRLYCCSTVQTWRH